MRGRGRGSHERGSGGCRYPAVRARVPRLRLLPQRQIEPLLAHPRHVREYIFVVVFVRVVRGGCVSVMLPPRPSTGRCAHISARARTRVMSQNYFPVCAMSSITNIFDRAKPFVL